MALETNLRGRSAVITGASEGIGRATAKLLASEGANLILTARNADRLAELKTKLAAVQAKIDAKTESMEAKASKIKVSMSPEELQSYQQFKRQ